MKRRTVLQSIASALAFPGAAISATWDELGCICRKIGEHWTICRKHWKDSTTDDFRIHLKETHGHKTEVDGLSRTALMRWHKTHHEGGAIYHNGKLLTIIPKPSASRNLKGKA